MTSFEVLPTARRYLFGAVLRRGITKAASLPQHHTYAHAPTTQLHQANQVRYGMVRVHPCGGTPGPVPGRNG